MRRGEGSYECQREWGSVRGGRGKGEGGGGRAEVSYKCQYESVCVLSISPSLPLSLSPSLPLSLTPGCHLKCHKEHTERNVEAMQPCVGGEQNIKRQLLLIKDRYTQCLNQ